MDFSIKGYDWRTAMPAVLSSQADCIVIGVFDEKNLSGAAQQIDTVTQGFIRRRIEAGDVPSKCGSTRMTFDVPGIKAGRLLIVRLGKRDSFDAKAFTQATHSAMRALCAHGIRHALWTLAQESVDGRDAAWAIYTTIRQARETIYRFTQCKNTSSELSFHIPKKITLTVDAAAEKSAKTALQQGTALASGMDLARNLANLPGNICTPTYLADTAKQLASEFTSLKAEILEKKHLESFKMGAFLAVAQGSSEPPKLIVLRYQGASAKQKPIVLVGKGITFDAGGISLKPAQAMDEMKFDMCGAATVLGLLRAVAEAGLKINVIGVIPSCENLPGGHACKPGDILTSMSGQTIEVLNTDAEGRLILCDALTYVERFKPAAVIDIATLTGACVIALGHHHSGLYTKEEGLADQLLAAAQQALDPAWRMPLDDEYQELLKSNCADMANIGGRAAGSITAACFLARFTRDYPWAHLDIAGTAYKTGKDKGATARPIPLLMQFLTEQAQ